MRRIRLGTTGVLAYFDVKLTDNVSPALNEAGGQPQILINNGSYDDTGIGTLTSVGFGTYTALLADSVILVVGDVLRTRYKSGITAECKGDTFLIVAADDTTPDDVISLSNYGTVSEGDLYFSSSLDGTKWKNSSPTRKSQALVSATRLIDRLNFAGCKSDSSQVLQFPRQNQTTDPDTGVVTTTQDDNVPDDIKEATYLIAERLLQGYDPDKEAENLTAIQQKYDKAATLFTREFIPDWKLAGIPSNRAWNLIRPYLRDPNELVLSRS